MSEDLTLIQRIKSASDIDVRTRGFIYELTDKDGRWSFLHRDVDGVFKPNFTKRLFYYINTSEFDLPLSFKDVPYKAEKIDAEVIFRLQLCPTADFDKDPELANWIASERLDVLRASDVKSRLAGRLGAYFSRIVNGATSLALAEQYGKGSFRDDYSAWNDSGLPSWLYIAKTASADVTRLPTEAEREVQLENERVARAMERTRKVKEQIDIAVSEAKLKEAQDAIAYHMEQLRQRRELENAQYALMLQQVETARERDLRAREIKELEHQIAKDSCRIDLAINYERLKQEQAKTQSIIQDAENKRRHNDAKIAKLNQEIEESKKRVKLLIIEHSLLWNIVITVCKWIVAILAILVLGVVVWKWMDKGRGELQKEVDHCQNEFQELKNSYRYVPWRENSFEDIEGRINDLKGKLEHVFSKTEVLVAVSNIESRLMQLRSLDKSLVEKESLAISQLTNARGSVDALLKSWPHSDELSKIADLEKLKAALAIEDFNVGSNVVNVVLINDLSSQLDGYIREYEKYQKDLREGFLLEVDSFDNQLLGMQVKFKDAHWRKMELSELQVVRLKINDLKEKITEKNIRKSECDNLCEEIKRGFNRLDRVSQDFVDAEKEALGKIDSVLKRLKIMDSALPAGFECRNVSKKTLSDWSRELESMQKTIETNGVIDFVFVETNLLNVLKRVEVDYKAYAQSLFMNSLIENDHSPLACFLNDEIVKESKRLEEIHEGDPTYYTQIMKALNLYHSVEFYNDKVVDLLKRIGDLLVRAGMSSLVVKVKTEIKDHELEYVVKFKKCVLNRSEISELIGLHDKSLRDIDSCERLLNVLIKKPDQIRNACYNAYSNQNWSVLMSNAEVLKDLQLRIEGENWGEIAKWGLLDRQCADWIRQLQARCKSLMAAYERMDVTAIATSDRTNATELVSTWLSQDRNRLLSHGPIKGVIDQVSSDLSRNALPQINNYLLFREICSFLNIGTLDDLTWVYESEDCPEALLRYIKMYRTGGCGKPKSLKKALALLTQLEDLGGEYAITARQLRSEMRGFSKN